MDDYIKTQKDTVMKSVMLTGGIKGWVAAGQEYTNLMDEYRPEAWSSS